MTDWEDASHEEHMARLDAALELLRMKADIEAGLHFDLMLDETSAFMWPPPPNTAHPGLVDHAGWVRDLIATGRHTVYLPPPRTPLRRLLTQSMDAPPDLSGPSAIALTVNRCWAPGVHVGEPYIWMWKVATDEHKRWIATDSWPVHHPDEPWRQP